MLYPHTYKIVKIGSEVLMRAYTFVAHILQVKNTRPTDQVPMRSRGQADLLRKAGACQRQMEKGCAIRVWQREEGLKARMG